MYKKLKGRSEQGGKRPGREDARRFHTGLCRGARRAVLIGSDLLHLTATKLSNYLDTLKTFPVVIGPAEDGGYSLIGFRYYACTEMLFRGIEWGSELVFEYIVRITRHEGTRFHVGEQMVDIDTIENLEMVLSNATFADRLFYTTKTCREHTGLSLYYPIGSRHCIRDVSQFQRSSPGTQGCPHRRHGFPVYP